MNRRGFVFFLTAMLPGLLLSSTACRKAKENADKIGQDVVIRTQDRANQLKLRKDLRTLNGALEIFHGTYGRYPVTLNELAEKGILARIPQEAFGGEWNYDSGSGMITSSSHPEYGTSMEWD
ncbi:hypothetical protein JXA40_11215 [bacterium]|nr:hypothetical protein [candidate division CSSED10-310 bacterium]